MSRAAWQEIGFAPVGMTKFRAVAYLGLGGRGWTEPPLQQPPRKVGKRNWASRYLSFLARRRDIQPRPVKAQMRSCGNEFVIVDGLDHVAVSEVIVGTHPVFVLVGSSKNHHREMLGAFVCAYRLEDFQAADLRYVQIQQRKRRLVAHIPPRVFAPPKKIVECIQTIAGADQLIVDLAMSECSHRQLRIIVIVLN